MRRKPTRDELMIGVVVEYLLVCPPDMEECFNREGVPGVGPVRCVRCWERWLDAQESADQEALL